MLGTLYNQAESSFQDENITPINQARVGSKQGLPL
jgi:hypothetical protein